MYKKRILYYDNSFIQKPFGLTNTGVICWMNSILQILIGMPSLNQYLINSDNHNDLSKTYLKILRDKSSNGGTMLLYELKSKTLQNNQQCVDEGLLAIIDNFNDKTIEKLFTICYKNTIKCTCGAEMHNYDTMFRIQMPMLSITSTTKKYRLNLSQYLLCNKNTLTDYKCNKCKKYIPTECISRLKQLNEIITVVLNNRFGCDNDISNAIIEFPRELIFNVNGHSSQLKYKLIGIIEYSGNRYGKAYNNTSEHRGHYWSHSLRNDIWCKFNDTHVSKSEFNDMNILQSKNAFMLFYHIQR